MNRILIDFKYEKTLDSETWKAHSRNSSSMSKESIRLSDMYTVQYVRYIMSARRLIRASINESIWAPQARAIYTVIAKLILLRLKANEVYDIYSLV